MSDLSRRPQPRQLLRWERVPICVPHADVACRYKGRWWDGTIRRRILVVEKFVIWRAYLITGVIPRR